MTYTDDARFMAHALTIGRRGMGQVWPNPAVGCVIVRDNRIVGRGWTATGGRPHAEPIALAQAGTKAQGATAYVTLEPCAHTGQTPPCAQALIDAQIGRVVIACGDRDPRVDGGGVAMLRAAGIAVETGVLAAEALEDHAGFLRRVSGDLPYLTLKLATTVDGRIATRTGESQWITGPDARRAVHAMRARHDAVMVGAGTVRADNPQLTVRGMGARRQPVRVVMTSDLDLPLDAGLFASTDDAPVWICHGAQADASAFVARGAVSVPCRLQDKRVDVRAALTALGKQGITRVFCEGGGMLAATLLRENLVDRLEVFQAGKVIGADGLAAVGGMDVAALADAAGFNYVQSKRVGADLWTTWRKP